MQARTLRVQKKPRGRGGLGALLFRRFSWEANLADLLRPRDPAGQNRTRNRQIGADSINVHRLQAWPFTALRELVESTPGYTIDSRQYVSSDTYSTPELKRIRRAIHREFYSVAQLWRILKKLYKLRVFTFSQFVTGLAAFPALVAVVMKTFIRYIKKKRGVCPNWVGHLECRPVKGFSAGYLGNSQMS